MKTNPKTSFFALSHTYKLQNLGIYIFIGFAYVTIFNN